MTHYFNVKRTRVNILSFFLQLLVTEISLKIYTKQVNLLINRRNRRNELTKVRILPRLDSWEQRVGFCFCFSLIAVEKKNLAHLFKHPLVKYVKISMGVVITLVL